MQRGRGVPASAVVLVGTSLAAFTATLDNTIVSVALREIQRDLGSGVTGLQGIVTAYTVAMAALLLAGGALVDAWGAKRVFLVGLVGFAVSSVGCALAPGVGTLIAWRAAQGAGASLLLPGGLALLAGTVTDPVQRRRSIGIWAAAAGVALVAGPVAGGELVAARGWPWVFWVNVPLCLLALLLVLRVPGPAAAHRRHLDLPGIALTCLALGLGTAAVVLAGHGSRSLMAACLAVAVAAAVGLMVLEPRVAEPLLPGPLLRDRSFRGAGLGTLSASLALFVPLVFLALFLQLVQDHDAQQTGRLLLALPAALVVMAAATTRWRATVLPVVVGLGITGAALLVLGARLSAGTSGQELGLLLALVGAGIGMTTAPLVTAALTAARGREGLGSAAVSMARELGGVIAIGGLGSVAVARLSVRLTDTLTAGGVSSQDRPALLDALLGARTADVRRLLLDDVGLGRALLLGPRLSSVATSSFVASTRLVLVLAGGLVLLSAAVCGWLLRPRD